MIPPNIAGNGISLGNGWTYTEAAETMTEEKTKQTLRLVRTPSEYKMVKHIEIDTRSLCPQSDGS